MSYFVYLFWYDLYENQMQNTMLSYSKDKKLQYEVTSSGENTVTYLFAP